MADREKVIKGLEMCWYQEKSCKHRECPYYMGEHELKVGTCERKLHCDAIALLKEIEQQKQGWITRIADEQVANAPDVFYPEDENARRMGVYQGLEIAFKILTGEDKNAEYDASMQERSNT